MGNLIYRQLPDGESQYFVYDTENRLIRAEIKKPAGNTEVWEYAYDPFGRRLSKERKDKLAWVSTEPKRTCFVWDGTRLLQEYTYKGSYTYIYTDQDAYEPLAQVFYNNKDGQQYLAYFHTDQIGIPREMTDQFGNLLWFGEYTAWGKLAAQTKVYPLVHQPFRLQNQYYDQETGLHYNYHRYYEPETGRFVSQDPIGLWSGNNLYQFSPNAQRWIDPWGLTRVYHYTSRAGYNGIMGTGIIEARDPGSRGKGAIKGKEKGVYVTTMNPEQLDASKARGQMGLTGEKSTHYISFEVDDSEIKRVDRQDGVKRLYLKDDVQLRDSNNKLKQGVEHGACGSTSKKSKKKKGK